MSSEARSFFLGVWKLEYTWPGSVCTLWQLFIKLELRLKIHRSLQLCSVSSESKIDCALDFP